MTAKRGGDGAFTRASLYGMGDEATYAGALSFMRRQYTRDLTGVDVAVSGVPLNTATSNRTGARFGPAGVRAASAMLAWGRPWLRDFGPFDRLAVVDYGDCAFDIDCLDPRVAPGTGTPVCGGLNTVQALGILRGLGQLDFLAMDVVEVAPAYDWAQVTALAGASLAYESLCLLAAKRPERAGT